MRQYKYMFPQFTFYDRTGIRKIMEAQAEKGWLLDRVSNFSWRFRRIEPKKIRFAVTYFPRASAYDPHPSDAQQDLLEFCAHSGWTLAATAAQMQIFYTERQDAIPIETDPALELENIHASAKKNYLPAYFTLGVLAVMQLILQIAQLVQFPLDQLSRNTTLFNFLSMGILLTMFLTETLGYFRWYRRAKKAAESGVFLETRGNRKFVLGLLTVDLALFALLLISMESRIALVMALYGLVMVAVFAITFGVHGWMKKRGASASSNRIATIVVSTVLATVTVSALVFLAISTVRSGLWDSERVVGTRQWGSFTFDIYNDPIPLKVEQLMEVPTGDYSYEAREETSLLLGVSEYFQQIYGPSEYPDLNYIVYSTKIPFIQELVRRELLAPSNYVSQIDVNGVEYYDTYVSINAADWGAEEAWQKQCMDIRYRDYVLFFEDCIVKIQPGWDMTAKQMRIVGEILGE